MNTGYILWASQKTNDYGKYVFWAKNECGYTAVLENCEIYPDYETASNAASRNCYGDVVPVRIEDIIPYTQTQTIITYRCETVLDKYKHIWKGK